MYAHILKKDLKNKKTMNLILLLFIILATMFVSSSVNNIATVASGLDGFFDRAGVSDYVFVTSSAGGQQDNISQILDQMESVTDYTAEPYLSFDNSVTKFRGKKLDSQGVNISSIKDARLTYFDENNQPIKEVAEGEVYLHRKVMEANHMEKGDIFSITVGDTTLDLKVAGYMKDAVLGSDMMGMARYLVCQEDYDRLASEQEGTFSPYRGCMYYVDTEDESALEKTLNESDNNIVFMANRTLLENTYVMDMVVAGALLIISLFLIIIAFLVIRFTIGFTLEEEYREIGVMKAIGINNLCIRGLYLVKYLAMSAVGTAMGFFLSLPFGNRMIDTISKGIVLENEHVYGVNLGCSLFVIVVVLLFCFCCTAKVNHFTPVDAIRSGSNGERFRKRSFLKLSHSHLGTSAFLACNDILSSLKKYFVMTLTFTITLTLILVMVNTVNTLRSNQLLKWFSITTSDVYVVEESDHVAFFGEDGQEKLKVRLEELEQLLAKHNMPASCCMENCSRYTLVNGDYICKSLTFQGIGTKADQYSYTEGTPPQNADEIAITSQVAKKLHAKIGDWIVIRQDEGDMEYLITALYQSMNSGGEGVRFHEDAKLSYARTVGFLPYQINFTDHPDQAEIEKRAEKMEELFQNADVFVGGEYTDYVMGGTTQMADSVRMLSVTVGLCICILVAVLMERSFIAQEQGEIAMMKAIGFQNRSIIGWHSWRIFLVLFVSMLLGILISAPVSQLSTGQVFRMMGAEFISFEIKPLQVYVLYPLLVMGSTLLSVCLTAQYTRKITPADTSGEE